MDTDLPTLGDKWETQKSLMASDTGKKIYSSVRFDGNGNSVVRFIVQHNGKDTPYEKYDAAATAYNMLP